MYREVERQRAREKRILADELLDVARVNGESIDETARAWPAAKWAAYVADPSLRERHERRRQDAEAADDRRRRRFVAEHQGRIAAL